MVKNRTSEHEQLKKRPKSKLNNFSFNLAMGHNYVRKKNLLIY